MLCDSSLERNFDRLDIDKESRSNIMSCLAFNHKMA